MTSRECSVLKHILNYCQEIDETVARFGDSFPVFRGDRDYKNSVAMSILQIGELSTQLSDEFKAFYPDIPWKDIRGMRNVMAHHYGKLDETILFEIVKKNIPELEQFLEGVLAEAQRVDEPADGKGPKMTL